MDSGVQKAVSILLFIVASAAGFTVESDYTVGIEDKRRDIRVDGFLLEWEDTPEPVFKDMPGLRFDAVLTEKGIAVCFRYDAGSDTLRSIRVFTENKEGETGFMILIDSSVIADNWAVHKKKPSVYTGEWLVPTGSLPEFSDTASLFYSVLSFTESSDRRVVFKPKPGIRDGMEAADSGDSSVFRTLVIQIISILVLLVAFFYLKKQIKRR